MEAVPGRSSASHPQPRLERTGPGVAAAVATVEERLGGDRSAPGDEPVFIFSAGHRSGSTLLQRLVVSADRHFIWDESDHHTDSVRRLAEALIPFGADQPAEGTADVDSRVSKLVDAHRAFVRELLSPPPAQADLGWGLKEARLPAEYGLYLRLLFPRARFLFLVRDPHSAYRAYSDRPTLFERWPRSQIRTPYAYGRSWRRLTESFLAYEQTLGAMLVRYEDLVPGSEAIDKLELLLGAPVDRSVLDREANASAGARRRSLSPLEATMLDRATHPLASRLGYSVA